LGPDVFDTATVDTCILILKKQKSNFDKFKAVTIKKEEKNDLFNVFEEKDTYIKITSSAWFVGSDLEYRLKEKIEKIGKPLKDWDVKIYYGIKTGLNKAFIITTEKRNEILANCKNEEERKRTEAIIKPILRGRDIKRYYYEWAGLWVIVIPAGWTNKNRGKEKPDVFIEKTFPSLMKHLKQFEKKAKERDDQGDYWWELRHCDYYEEFEKEKVVWNRITENIIFSYLPSGLYILDSTFMFTGNNLKYLLALLNSKLCGWWTKISAATLGEGNYGAKIYIENTPLAPINKNNQKIVNEIEFFINKILSVENNDVNLIMKYQNQIDQLVYKIYDLSEEEIKNLQK